MNKRISVKLGVYLTLATLLSFLAAVIMFVGLNNLSDTLLNVYWYPREKIAETENSLAEELLLYVNENKVSYDNIELLDAWAVTHKDVILLVYSELGDDISGNYDVYSGLNSPEASYRYLRQVGTKYISYYRMPFYGDNIMFTYSGMENTRLVGIIYCPQYSISTVLRVVAVLVCFVVFALALIYAIRRKMNYIKTIGKELSAIASGDIYRQITIKGTDEITGLAENIEGMRLSFIERLEGEDKARKANQELVTSMSHDLRTPLTSLMGYLDILSGGLYDGDAQRDDFINAAKSKAYRIKEMTDALFEYSLVYREDDNELELIKMDAITACCQLIEESSESLSFEGFEFEYDIPNETAIIKLDITAMKRVYDNIFSNIRKYADKSKPICISMKQEDKLFSVSVSNTIAANNNAETSGIGLKTIQKLIKRHNGEFITQQNDQIYVSTIKYPIIL